MCKNVQSQANSNFKPMHCATKLQFTVKASRTVEFVSGDKSEVLTNGSLMEQVCQTQTLITNIPCLLGTTIFNILQVVEKN